MSTVQSQSGRRMLSPVFVNDDGAIFTPFIDDSGGHPLVGFMIQTHSRDGLNRITYVYMVPSNGDDGEGTTANVFVYAGHSGDPEHDMPMTYIEA